MSQEKLDHFVAGAIFDFMGWLTTRQEKLVLSSADDAAPAAEAVKEFLTMRGVAQDCEPMIHDWPARNAVIEALSGVQALSAASPTPPAEQQADPKAAPGEQDDHQILAITTAYEQGVGKGHQAYNSGKEIANPYSPAYRCDLAWQYGYKEGKEQAQREAKAAPGVPVNGWPVKAKIYKRRDEWVLELSGVINDCAFTCRHTQPGYLQPEDVAGLPSIYSEGTAPQPAPAPLSETPYEKRKAIQEGEQIGASDAWFKARHEMLDTVDRRNVFRAGFDRGWSAAIAAQGGKT
ncbi:MAG: hypothetical protein ACRC52_12755 [Aeromonas veronii]